MKKLISLVLSLAILFAVAMPSSAVLTIDNAGDALKSAVDLRPLSLDAIAISAVAEADDGKIALLGYDNDGNNSLWFMDGYTVTKCTTDLSALAEANLDIPTGDDIKGGDYIYFSDVYYFGGAFYVVCESSYYCMCDDGPHDFNGLCTILRTENGKDFTAIKMPSFREPMFLNRGGVAVVPFGDKLIYASYAGGFTKTGETTDEYGYPRATGVSYYYTSEDSVNWTRHASVEVEVMYMEDLFWLFEGISEDGCALFQVFAESPSMTGGSSYGYYATTDFTTYKEMPESVFGDEYFHNSFSLSRASEYADQMAILMQAKQELNEETFYFDVTGFDVYAADSADGEWTQKIDFDGAWEYYHYFFTDNDACIMLKTLDGTNVYKWSGVDGAVTTDTTDIDITMIGGGVGRTYKDDMVFYMLYNEQHLLISKDMWNTCVQVELPVEFDHAVGVGGKLILVGAKCYAVDLDALGAAVVDGIVGGGESDLPGDADGNGSVNLSDVSLVMKKVAGWDVTVNETLSDVTGDGAVNLSDASLMMKYIAGWDVVLG